MSVPVLSSQSATYNTHSKHIKPFQSIPKASAVKPDSTPSSEEPTKKPHKNATCLLEIAGSAFPAKAKATSLA